MIQLAIFFAFAILVLWGMTKMEFYFLGDKNKNVKVADKTWFDEEEFIVPVKIVGEKGSTSRTQYRFLRMASDFDFVKNLREELELHDHIVLEGISHEENELVIKVKNQPLKIS